jgi:hypothetical protein
MFNGIYVFLKDDLLYSDIEFKPFHLAKVRLCLAAFTLAINSPVAKQKSVHQHVQRLGQHRQRYR